MALAGVCSRAEAQAYHDVAPIAPPSMAKPAAPVLPPEPADSSQDIAVATLRGLQFEAADSAAAPAARHAIVAIDLPLLAPAFLQSFDADLGRPLTFDRLAQIRRAVVQRYRDAGQPLVDVYVPEQDVSDGVVRIVVATFRVGQVVARGNRAQPRLSETLRQTRRGAREQSENLDAVEPGQRRDIVDCVYDVARVIRPARHIRIACEQIVARSRLIAVCRCLKQTMCRWQVP
ncbi:POTRA domain-containing protein [Paraburkholderia sediminicola]|uniref:POTRA domain-containing protein n=1 Tax=Paraburkholderia sediminicola TaxID=458836 RepID=UPI0038BBF8DA